MNEREREMGRGWRREAGERIFRESMKSRLVPRIERIFSHS